MTRTLTDLVDGEQRYCARLLGWRCFSWCRDSVRWMPGRDFTPSRRHRSCGVCEVSLPQPGIDLINGETCGAKTVLAARQVRVIELARRE